MDENKEMDLDEVLSNIQKEIDEEDEKEVLSQNMTDEEIYQGAPSQAQTYIEDDEVNLNYQNQAHGQGYQNPYQQHPQYPYPQYQQYPQYPHPHPHYPQHPQMHMPYQQAQQNNFNPHQNPYPPYGYNPYMQMPYGYEQNARKIKTYPPLKKEKRRSVRIFAWSMLILFIGSLGGFIATTAYYSATNPAVENNLFGNQDSFNDFFEGFEGFDDFDDFDGFDNTENYGDAEDIPEVVPVPDDEKGEEVEADLYGDEIIINSQPLGEEFSAQEVYEKVLPSIVLVKAEIFYDDESSEEGYGTGMFMTQDGYILTNSHVVFDTKNVAVTVTDNNENEYNATVLAYDRTMDLAVLKVNGEGFTPVEFGSSDDLSLGQWVLAIGNPGGESFSKSITRGIVSGLDRTLDNEQDMKYIQTDAAISPGNSGGPLVNMYGQVVGITTAKITAEDYEGIGLAIPVSDAKTLIDQLLSKGYVEGRVRLGITGANAAAINPSLPTGVLVIEIEEDSAFVGTDVKVDDVITYVDGERIHGLDDLSSLLLLYSPGDAVTVTIDRFGEEIDVEIVLLADMGETQK